MGNTSASPNSNKETSADTRCTAADLDLLPLRERFEELAATTPAQQENGEIPGHGQEQRFVLFDDWSKLVGPRGAQVAERLYRALDADRDGRLDFEEFSGAACLLKGSTDEKKIAVLYKMYGDLGRGGLVGQEGLKAFILDIIAASPPPLGPPKHVNGGDEALRSSPSALRRRGSETGLVVRGGEAGAPDFELELESVLARMAGVVLIEYDGDSDGMLTEKEWRAYLKREEESVGAFLETLSNSVGKLLLLP